MRLKQATGAAVVTGTIRCSRPQPHVQTALAATEPSSLESVFAQPYAVLARRINEGSSRVPRDRW